MGCNIHLHIEVKLNGKWEHWAAPNIERDYDLFAKMAGVRNEDNISPIAKLKGIPDDVTVVTKFQCDRGDGYAHGHSWFGLEEIKQLADYVDKQWDGGSLEYDILRGSYLCGNTFAGFLKFRSDYPKEITDVRFIFWFDS